VQQSAPPKPEPPEYEPREAVRITPHQPLEQPEALVSFYDALAGIDGVEEPGIVRVVHLGASMIGYDDLTGVLRERFQTRFGDGGAGLVMLQRYMYNYKHLWVDLRGSGWDDCFIRVRCRGDGHYGLGGVTFETDGGARTRISTREHELGDEAAHFEVWFAATRKGGKLQVKIDGGAPTVLSARAPVLEDRYHAIDVEQGPHTIDVRAIGPARGYGVVLETRGPGIVWDQFSMIGVYTRGLLAWNREHIADQIAHRNPDLLVFSFGGNDSRRVLQGHVDQAAYAAEYLAVVERVRAGKPGVACLITATADRRSSMGHRISPKQIEIIVDAQREVARTAGCAFFDTYTAMGGANSFDRWRRHDPPLASRDQIHLTHAGQELLGGWIYDAIVAGYVHHRRGGATTRR
jgi:lysophospholipase L1-like esterase